MARKVGEIIARGDRRWLIRVYLGRDHETTGPPRFCKTVTNPNWVIRTASEGQTRQNGYLDALAALCP
jgi:hypothetical protein